MEKGFSVINLHLTEKCNYHCVYCFAKFHQEDELEMDQWIHVVNQIKTYFNAKGIKNGRINLAGGEPLIVPYLDRLIDYINQLGISVSVITNGSLLTVDRITKWINKVDMIGVSIDSLKQTTNLLIGRNQRGTTIHIPRLIDTLNFAQRNNILIKVNTVVSKLNLNENLTDLYESINLDRIKLLQVRVNDNCNESAAQYAIANEEFKTYCNHYENINNLIIESDEDIESSYVIIDPHGDLITNDNHNQRTIGSLLNHHLDDLIHQANINETKFYQRYSQEGEW